MLKSILNMLLGSSEPAKPQPKGVSQDEVEALVDARIKEHAATLEKATAGQIKEQSEDYSLTDKQIDFALSLLAKVKDYELAVHPSTLTLKDLNKFIAYNRFKNKGILVNLEKKGVIRKN
ncbi:ABC transporter ATP-binding protein [Bacillus sp. B-jedd]|uniref:ABC transporter ATP-binding protein n=1 Tax=Bacillus sp. B-jedd TaxID=1476857 RepID=UPI00051559AC|nr:ABC transporter ATP-binding protein [Bacillus sp. B-jedd]CEG27148.1 hypothetical protein BN1002_02004 [Bacillus sp. B-jedd]